MYLFSPYSVELEYGVPFNYIDITEKYDELVANPNIRKTKIKARDLETEISKLQQESGYPYVVNIDTANRANPVDGKIIMSNLCSEILQVQNQAWSTMLKNSFKWEQTFHVTLDQPTWSTWWLHLTLVVQSALWFVPLLSLQIVHTS